MNFILLFVSWLLKLIVIPIGIILTIWVFLLQPKTFINSMSNWFYDIALATDKWGNSVLKYPLNKWFINSSGYQFGNIKDSISGVCGENKKTNTLLKPGIVLAKILDAIQTNHVENAAETINTNQ